MQGLVKHCQFASEIVESQSLKALQFEDFVISCSLEISLR